MPIGMVIWRWDERAGAEIIERFPIEVKIDQKTLMQLYSQHLYTAKADVVSLYIGALNIVSLWTGSIYNYFLTLLLLPEENGDDYQGIVSDTMAYLMPYLEQDTAHELIESIYNRISQYTFTNLEQKYAIFYTNEINRLILTMLQEEGVYYKAEMEVWLNDKLKTRLFNFDMVIDRLSQFGFLKLQTIEGLEGSYLFLLKHLTIFRVPPDNLYEMLRGVTNYEDAEKIKTQIVEYFQHYQPTERDGVEIANVLADRNYYRIIERLRKSAVTREGLHKLRLFGVNTPLDIIKELERLNIALSLKMNTGEWIYCLKSDIAIDASPPEYIMNALIEMQVGQRKSKQLLVTYLNVLKTGYYDQVAKEKELARQQKKLEKMGKIGMKDDKKKQPQKLDEVAQKVFQKITSLTFDLKEGSKDPETIAQNILMEISEYSELGKKQKISESTKKKKVLPRPEM